MYDAQILVCPSMGVCLFLFYFLTLAECASLWTFCIRVCVTLCHLVGHCVLECVLDVLFWTVLECMLQRAIWWDIIMIMY